jgi:hypothetical protein
MIINPTARFFKTYMNQKKLYMILLLGFFFVLSVPGFCLESEDIITLNQAGVSGETIQLLVQERAIETCSFTVQEIVQLKNAGVGDETIRMLIKQASFLKDKGPIVYGKDIKSIKLTTVKDIIELKNAGVSEDVIRAIVIFATRDANAIEREKAWDMLKNAGIVVDMRDANKRKIK